MSTTVPDIQTSGTSSDVGDTVNVTVTIRDTSDTVTDPTTLSVKVKPPGASATTYVYGTDSELTKTSTGIYVLAYPATVSGWHNVRAITTGDAGAEPGRFYVREDNTA